MPLNEVNLMLLQVVRSVSRAVGGKVHFLSICEHFISKKGKIIKPTYKYFQEQGDLTPLGCLVFRECVMCEVGIKPYWF